MKKGTKKENVDVERFTDLMNCRTTSSYESLIKKIQEIIMKSFKTNERPKVFLNCYDCEFWFTDTRNPRIEDVETISYNQLVVFQKVIESGLPFFVEKIAA